MPLAMSVPIRRHLTVTVDKVAPDAPTVAAFVDTIPAWSATASRPPMSNPDRNRGGGQHVNVYDGATLLGTATANGSGAWGFTTGDAGRGRA